MATRFYFSTTAVPPNSPGFAAWTRTADAVRRRMLTQRDNSAVANLSIWNSIAAAANDTALAIQLCSDVLTPGIVFQPSDTIKCQQKVREGTSSANINRNPICVKIYNGTTLKATLLPLSHWGPGATEWPSATQTNRSFADGDMMVGLGGDYTTVAGDYLVVELGGQIDATGSAVADGILRVHADAASDMPEDEVSTSAFNSWFETSLNLTFETFVPRHRVARPANPSAIFPGRSRGRWRGRRTPHAGMQFSVPRHRTAQPASPAANLQGSAIFPGRVRRLPVPGSGLSAISFVMRRHRDSMPRAQAPTGRGQLYAGRTRRPAPPSPEIPVRQAERRWGKSRFIAPPDARVKRRRFILIDPPAPTATGASRRASFKGPPPQRNHTRRGQVPGSGLTEIAAVPRRRIARGAPFVFTGRVRRSLPQATPDDARHVVPRHAISRSTAPVRSFGGHVRRALLPSIESLPPPPRRNAVRTERRPPLAGGKAKRSAVPGSNMTSGTGPRIRFVHQQEPRLRGARAWRHGFILMDFTPAPIVPRHRVADGNRRPVPIVGKVRRGQVPGSGLVGQATILRRRWAKSRRSVIPLVAGRSWRRYMDMLSNSGQNIGGFYYTVAGQLYFAGAAEGALLVE